MKKYFAPAIGIVAFVVGGLVAREKAFDMIESLEKSLSSK